MNVYEFNFTQIKQINFDTKKRLSSKKPVSADVVS